MSKNKIQGGHAIDSPALCSSDVLSCPFCRNQKLEMVWEKCDPICADDTDRIWWVECQYCGGCGPRSNTEPEAISRWNTRATEFHTPLWPDHHKNSLGQDAPGERPADKPKI